MVNAPIHQKGDLSPILKKGENNSKSNYRPKLSSFQSDFRKNYSTQHALIVMAEKFIKVPDNAGTFSAHLANLSKAFDCIKKHDSLLAKLHTLRFNMSALYSTL